MTNPERAAVAQLAPQWLTQLQQWIRIPSVSADPAHHQDVRKSAQYLAEQFQAAGFPTVRVMDQGPYLPAVYAHWPAGDSNAVRVVIYGHHDVQPAEIADGWSFDPFEPTITNGRLTGRGASDDKGNVAMHLLGLGAHLAATGRTSPAVDLTYIVEGEEESGSPHISQLLADLTGHLDADMVMISDTGVFNRDTPSVVTGMRGLISCEVTVTGPDIDLHSGSFGGGVANPISELVRVLAAIHDENKHIAIPGFYEGVAEPTADERQLMAALPFDEQQWVTGPARSRMPVGEAGYSTLERIGMRPTAEINGIYGGYTGAGGKTIVPHQASAKLSFRLVGQQDPADIMTKVGAFLRNQISPAVGIDIEWEGHGVAPLVVAADHPTTLLVRRALGQAFDTDQVLITREGGSGPEAELAQTLPAPMVFLGVITDKDQIHAPDESADLELLYKGAEAVAHSWRELAAAGRHALA